MCVQDKDRTTVFISLTVVSLVGSFLFFLIQKVEPEVPANEESQSLVQAESTETAVVV